MLLDPGEIVPSFRGAALSGNSNFAFDTVAGRPLILLVLGSGRWQPGAEALALLARYHQLFDDRHAGFFGVTVDPTDAADGRIAQRIPGIRWFLDYDAAISRALGAVAAKEDGQHYQPHWLLLDAGLRVIQRAAIDQGEAIFAALRAMLARGPEQTNAPVLTVPRVFEPELCRRLVDLYETHGGTDSGFMREENGITVARMDHSHKRRLDYQISDEALQRELLDRLRRRLTPQIRKAFHFHPTRIERWIIGCYDGESGGFFRPHRDNTTAGTAHRKFACTINLNAEDYDGGELRFPEFGTATYRAPTGGAVVFSCSLLHEATPVTRGKRYAFLPFFYDEAGALLREKNQASLEESLGDYKSGLTEAVAAE